MARGDKDMSSILGGGVGWRNFLGYPHLDDREGTR